MPPIVLLGALALAAAVPLLVLAFVSNRGTPKEIRENLSRGFPSAATQRGPSGFRLASLGRLLVMPWNVALLDKQLARAGRPAAWPLQRLLLLKPILCLVGGFLGFLYVRPDPSGIRILLASVVTAVAYFVPDLLIYSRGQERQNQIQLELPDTLDQMNIAVEAGLGFEAAMSRAGENGKGPLAEELVRTLQDMQVGRSRRESYLALAQRTTVQDLKNFVRSVVQADMYGIAISTVLRTQAKEMRLKRRQRAEEKAMQIPVKVIFPLMLCILPVLFIVLMGPAVMDIVAAFSK